MHAVGGAVAQRRSLEHVIDPQLVERVPGLVHGAEEVFAKEVLVGPDGDAHVVGGKGGHEGMRRVVDAAAVEVEAHQVDHTAGKGALGADGEAPADDGIVVTTGGGDPPKQRDQPRPQLRE